MKRYELVVQPRVYQEMVELAAYIEQESPTQADRFADAAARTLGEMTQWPGPLSRDRLMPDHPTRGEIRRWNIDGFPNHTFIFTIAGADVVVLRCVHAARITGGFLRKLGSEDAPLASSD